MGDHLGNISILHLIFGFWLKKINEMFSLVLIILDRIEKTDLIYVINDGLIVTICYKLINGLYTLKHFKQCHFYMKMFSWLLYEDIQINKTHISVCESSSNVFYHCTGVS